MAEKNGKISSDERFVRWQTVLREHMTYMNSLLLTISIGVVGFLLTLLKERYFNPVSCGKLFFTIGLISSFFSILIGIVTGYSRLKDFRATVQKIRAERMENKLEVIDDLARLSDLYGRTTWNLFYSQIITIGLGLISLLIAFIIIYSEKLF